MFKVRGARFVLAIGLAVAAMGFAACGDDEEEDAQEQVDSALSQAASVGSEAQGQGESIMSDAQEQIDSALSQADSALDEATSEAGSVAEEATSEAGSVAEEVTSAAEEATSEAAAGGDAAAGKEVFTANCGGCHTLADAGTSGAVGPNLDDLAPSQEQVAAKVAAGGGGMPSFSGTLSEADIANVAAYVSSVAGQ